MNKEQIKQAIRKAIETDPNKKDILKVSLFGSHAYGNPRPDSDVDILIEFLPNASIGFFKFFDTQYNFEDFTGKKVDLLTPESLSKYFREKVIAKAETIYERK
ncbi:MAG: nucleotidyltransferase domain-containing protein [Candidatus Moraniibacteriota bacterium]